MPSWIFITRRFRGLWLFVAPTEAWLKVLVLLLGVLCFGCVTKVHAQVWISEVLFNPPGSPDSPAEYIELRSKPNTVLGPETYLVVLEGDGSDNPGAIENIFDLSNRAFGPNGFLVLLQKTNSYAVDPGARVLEQTGSGQGWGSGGSSSIRHRGRSGQTEIENASETFLLVLAPGNPGVGTDLDVDDDGVLDGDALGWVILDSVGVLDDTGTGDIVYGLTNFRRSSGSEAGGTAGGNVISIGFDPAYVARNGNSRGHSPGDWVAGDNLNGKYPHWVLGGPTHTWPLGLSQAALDHLGAPNFGAPALAGVTVKPNPPATLEVAEGGAPVQYTLQLNTVPSAPLEIQILSDAGIRLAMKSEGPYQTNLVVALSNALPIEVFVSVADDNVVEASPRERRIVHRLNRVPDVEYQSGVIPDVVVEITDNDFLILSEVVANPAGDDAVRELIELVGRPEALLTNVFLAWVRSGDGENLGEVDRLISLSGRRLGRNGVLLLASPRHPYVVDPLASFMSLPVAEDEGGIIPNGALSIFLFATEGKVKEGEDWDDGDNGVLEGLPKDTRLLDSIGWGGGGTNEMIYGTPLSLGTNGIPDAAVRFPGDFRPLEPSAWFFGDLKEEREGEWGFVKSQSSANLPSGAVLTPGSMNNTAPSVTGLEAWTGAVGDPTNPMLLFTVLDRETPVEGISVWVKSSAPEVIPEANMTVHRMPGGRWGISFRPVGVGYASISVMVSDGQLTHVAGFRYAASAARNERTRFLMGAGDGSAVVPLPGGVILVGDDENQVIRLYDRTRSGYPMARFNMTPFLGLTDIEAGLPREVDIEGVTRLGDRLFWIGAHSHANIAEPRTNRSRLFATDLTWRDGAVSLQYVGRYDYLKLDLVDWDHDNGHGKGEDYLGLDASTREGVDPKAPDGSGFNIEGLAMAPGSASAAYVAFRAPLVPAVGRFHALVVPVLNYTELSVSNGPPRSAVFGAPIELDLFGRGIRSIEGQGTNFLIVAGPPGPAPAGYPTDFRLFTWTGNPKDPPQLRAADLSGMNPEAIVELPSLPWTAETEVQLLSDSGVTVWYGDRTITKALPEVNFKKCRTDWVKLGAEVEPEPYIMDVIPRQGGTRVRWRGVRGHGYRLEWSDTLQGAQWKLVPGSVQKLVTPVGEAIHDLQMGVQRYYRVVGTGAG